MTSERLLRTASLTLATALVSFPGLAQQQYAVSDTQLQTNITAALHNDKKLTGNTVISVSAAQGTVTLSGTVASEDARMEAEQVTAGVSGVRSIQDNMDVSGPAPGTAPAQATGNEAPPPPDEPDAAPSGPAQTSTNMPPPPPPDSAPLAGEDQRDNPAYTPYPDSSAQTAAPPPGGSYGRPDYGPRGNAHVPYSAPALAVSPERQDASGPVGIPPGTLLSVRITDPLSTANLKGGEYFQATAASDVYANGVLAVPRGTVLTGQVVEAKNAGALAGTPRLELRLTSLQLGPTTYPLESDVWSSQGPSKSGYTATNTVGGAAVGALIGAVAGGGLGAGVGAIAGGTTGAVISGATHGPRLTLPPETLLQFHLDQPLTVQPVRYSEAARLAASAPPEPVLQHRPAYVAAPYPYGVRPYPYYVHAYPYGYYRPPYYR